MLQLLPTHTWKLIAILLVRTWALCFEYFAFFGSCVLLFFKHILLDKILFSEFLQVGTKGRFLPVFGTAFTIVCEIPGWGLLKARGPYCSFLLHFPQAQKHEINNFVSRSRASFSDYFSASIWLVCDLTPLTSMQRNKPEL